MKIVKAEKKGLLGDRQSRTIDEKLAQILPDYVAEESYEAKAAEREMLTFRDVNDKTQEDVDIENLQALIRGYKGQVEYLQGEVSSLEIERNAARAERDRQRKEKIYLAKRLTASEMSQQENARLAELFRSHLDDSASDMECDNEWMQEARQMTWNEVDADYQGGIDE